jgi:hypothetical protein
VTNSPAQPKSPTVTRLLTQNGTKRDRVAILLADDSLSDDAIAKDLGIGRRTIGRWKQDSDFAALVGDYRGKIIAEALRLPIAKKHERIRILNDLQDSYLTTKHLRGKTYEQIAQTPEEAAREIFGGGTPPWAATGMYLQQPKIAASGKTVVEWAFDKALDSAIKETQKQAATELGQWSEKREVSGPGGGPVVVREIHVPRPDGED